MFSWLPSFISSVLSVLSGRIRRSDITTWPLPQPHYRVTTTTTITTTTTTITTTTTTITTTTTTITSPLLPLSLPLLPLSLPPLPLSLPPLPLSHHHYHHLTTVTSLSSSAHRPRLSHFVTSGSLPQVKHGAEGVGEGPS